MAFRLAVSETFKAKVRVSMKNDKGQFHRSDFMAEFKRYSTDELEDMQKQMTNRQVVEDALVGWEGVLAEDGSRIDFDETNKAIMIQIPQALHGLIEAFWTSVFEARQKN